jgi:oxygen-independent coproporphyrinogen III oxidase
LRKARDLSDEGLMRVEGDRLMLTARGRILSSSVFGELLADEPVLA